MNWLSMPPYFDKSRQDMLRFANPAAHSVLEVGCGHGLIKKTHDAVVTLIDIFVGAI